MSHPTAHDFLRDLALVLAVAAFTTVLFHRIKKPVVLGYLLAGAIISPNTPLPLVASLDTVHLLSEFGVILLMFSLGLEFSLRKLVAVGPRAAFVALVQCSFMFWVGYTVGQLFGFTTLECLFTGAAISISSTTIIVKAFEEQKVRGKMADLVFAILIVEDLIAIILLAVLTPIATGATLSAGSLAWTMGRLALFLAFVLGAGMLTVPRAVRYVIQLKRPETTLVAAIGLCFGIAYLAQLAGYSVALGAFLAGALVAESGQEKRVEHLVQPVRDMFAAIFFVSVGMLIDPAVFVDHWAKILVLTLVVLVGQVGSVTVGAFLSGHGLRLSLMAGLCLAQIGEFSFIIAGVGLSLGAVGKFLYPVTVVVSAITTFTTPWFIRSAPQVYDAVNARLPPPLRTFAGFYEPWLDRLLTAKTGDSFGERIGKALRLMLIDAACVIFVVFGVSFLMPKAIALLEEWIGLSRGLSVALIYLGMIALSFPFLVGLFRCARSIAVLLAARVFQVEESAVLESPARQAFVLALKLGILTAAGWPLVVLTQPMLPALSGGVALVGALGALAYAFWKTARTFDVQARAGAESVLDAFSRQMVRAPNPSETTEIPVQTWSLFGALKPVRLIEGSFAVGRSLVDLDLRGRTGATALAVERDHEKIVPPRPKEALRIGDVVALAGPELSVEAAARILLGGDAGSIAPPPIVQ